MIIQIDTDKLAEAIAERKKNCFKPREHNEKNCFDLAVGSVTELIQSENKTFDLQEFYKKCLFEN